MDAQFWLDRWREGSTHFHQNRVTPLLQKYWPALALPPGAQVLVPLCGKTLDMVWLAQAGYRVLGVELSDMAVQQFFEEQGLTPAITPTPVGVHYTAGAIDIICGDIFDLDAATLARCTGVFDRAALVALPQAMRQRYVDHVYGQLAPDYQGVLITLDYDQAQMDGPPFSVADAEVQTLFGAHSRADIISRRDMLDKEPKFAQRGLTHLDTVVYQLAKLQNCRSTM